MKSSLEVPLLSASMFAAVSYSKVTEECLLKSTTKTRDWVKHWQDFEGNYSPKISMMKGTNSHHIRFEQETKLERSEIQRIGRDRQTIVASWQRHVSLDSART